MILSLYDLSRITSIEISSCGLWWVPKPSICLPFLFDLFGGLETHSSRGGRPTQGATVGWRPANGLQEHPGTAPSTLPVWSPLTGHRCAHAGQVSCSLGAVRFDRPGSLLWKPLVCLPSPLLSSQHWPARPPPQKSACRLACPCKPLSSSFFFFVLLVFSEKQAKYTLCPSPRVAFLKLSV